MNHVYIGWDKREAQAFEVAKRSCEASSSKPVRVIPLVSADLYQQRMLWRPVEHEGGLMLDHLSGAHQSTEFAVSRFVVPFLHRKGWALFCDCDVVFLGDVAELFALADDRYAVMCVKHDYRAHEGLKMDGQPNRDYPRKNWSSVMLWNCDHVANTRLNLGIVNHWPGANLHRLCWLKDEEIGGLPAEWNWLVNVTERPANPRIAHLTLGGPWLPNWRGAEHDKIWMDAHQQLVQGKQCAQAL